MIKVILNSGTHQVEIEMAIKAARPASRSSKVCFFIELVADSMRVPTVEKESRNEPLDCDFYSEAPQKRITLALLADGRGLAVPGKYRHLIRKGQKARGN